MNSSLLLVIELLGCCHELAFYIWERANHKMIARAGSLSVILRRSPLSDFLHNALAAPAGRQTIEEPLGPSCCYLVIAFRHLFHHLIEIEAGRLLPRRKLL